MKVEEGEITITKAVQHIAIAFIAMRGYVPLALSRNARMVEYSAMTALLAVIKAMKFPAPVA
jgi:hypothetical protein